MIGVFTSSTNLLVLSVRLQSGRGTPASSASPEHSSSLLSSSGLLWLYLLYIFACSPDTTQCMKDKRFNQETFENRGCLLRHHGDSLLTEESFS